MRVICGTKERFSKKGLGILRLRIPMVFGSQSLSNQYGYTAEISKDRKKATLLLDIIIIVSIETNNGDGTSS